MISFYKVTGDSLDPIYRSGDYVLLLKFPWVINSIRPGDVVVFQQIAYGMMIKIVETIEPDSGLISVVGANPDSTDSRQFGPIHRSDLIGKAFWHIRGPGHR